MLTVIGVTQALRMRDRVCATDSLRKRRVCNLNVDELIALMYQFIQLSDIHFGQERNGSIYVHEDIRRSLCKDAAQLAQKRGPVDLVIVAGDTAYAGKEEEYERAGQWLELLTEAVKCKVTDVRVVPGNHDCDRFHLRRHVLNQHRAIREGTPKSAYADLADMASGDEEAHPLLPKFRAYRSFAARYDSDFDSIVSPLWKRDYPLDSGFALRLVGMNSVLVSDAEDRPGNMILGDAQYVLPEESGRIYIVIVHHPLDWLKDKAEAQQYLRNRSRVMMFGHEHVPHVVKMSDELGNEWLDIYAGAASPPERETLRGYVYNWLEIELRQERSSYALAVAIHPRVWIPELTNFTPDIQRLQGREFAEFVIACPGLKVTARGHDVEQKASEVEKRILAPSSQNSAQKSDEAIMNDEEAMAKLKFLFWRYLSWQQRLKVLVQADVLPPTADRPLPRTMERLALERARQQDKLGVIWDNINGFVPGKMRQANPFHSTRR